MTFALDYEKMLFLDAGDLAEVGIKRAYDSMRDVFRRYASDPVEVQELIDADAPSYSVKCGGVEYVIYSPELPHDLGGHPKTGHRRSPQNRPTSRVRDMICFILS
jgi:hypothetical protein